MSTLNNVFHKTTFNLFIPATFSIKSFFKTAPLFRTPTNNKQTPSGIKTG